MKLNTRLFILAQKTSSFPQGFIFKDTETWTNWTKLDNRIDKTN